jgi:SAM-dependent methyltransferase
VTTLNSRTISDFGEQWTQFPTNTGYWASLDCLKDIFGPLYDVGSLQGKYVAEIGSGAGRIVNMLLDAGASRVVAIEPARCFPVLVANVRRRSNRVLLVHAEGETIREYVDLDFVCSIGVLHHITDPDRLVAASLCALKPGGKMLIWVYGLEGNQFYIWLCKPLRALTTKLPHASLDLLVSVLLPALIVYMKACLFLPLPLRPYMLNYISRLDWLQLRRAIYDQLNPAFARFYTRQEAIDLLGKNGFTNVDSFHRHKFGWTVIGERPQK